MKTEKINIYTFSELSDEAKEKAREWYRNEETYESCWLHQSAIDYIGYKYPFLSDIKAQWSLGYCQSDGFDFTKAEIDLAAWMKAEKIASKYRTLFNLAESGDAHATLDFTHTGGGHGYSSIIIEADAYIQCNNGTAEDGRQEKADYQATEVESLLIDALRSIEHEAYSCIMDEYEYMNEDAQVDESIVCNEYEFTADGTIH